ncbi:MAG: hypothetical protein JRN12_02440 [Nitrososphaerota archaeon]|jgi:hypothetical protein|nr:hypothetical protein [Nitrososphaerota archaeon]MDG6942973.1 hypothetical protein [Nitrososphaerota archaeon]MDG6950701.1 hypothetical protein [Nitrososphaerota archaeon]
MRFEETRKFEADPAEIWRKVSAIKEIPKYWYGTRTIEVLNEERNATHVRMKFAFGGSGEASISKDELKRLLTIDYTVGPLVGKQTVTVDEGQIVAVWDVRFKGIYRLASKWSKGHFRSGTVHALERLTNQERLV